MLVRVLLALRTDVQRKFTCSKHNPLMRLQYEYEYTRTCYMYSNAHLEVGHALRDLRGPREKVARTDAVLVLAQVLEQRACALHTENTVCNWNWNRQTNGAH